MSRISRLAIAVLFLWYVKPIAAQSWCNLVPTWIPSEWRATTHAPSSGWNDDPNFDLSQWWTPYATSNAGVWADGVECGQASRLAWFRASFELGDYQVQPSATVRFLADDDGDVYVNGQLAFADHNCHAENSVFSIEIGHLLRPGVNVIGVAADDCRGTCRRMYLDVLLPTTAVSPPTSQIVCLGTACSFAVSLTSPRSGAAFQWMHNGIDIPLEGEQGNRTARESTLVIPSVRIADVGRYDCVVTNPCGTTIVGAELSAVRCAPTLSVAVRWSGDEVDCGHVFLELDPRNGAPPLEVGFVPTVRLPIGTVPGFIQNEFGRGWRWKITYPLLRWQYDEVIRGVVRERAGPNYNVLTFNCVDWAVGYAHRAGKVVPPYRSLGISDPRELFRSLERIGDGAVSPTGGTVHRNGSLLGSIWPIAPMFDWLEEFGLRSTSDLASLLGTPLNVQQLDSIEVEPAFDFELAMTRLDEDASLLAIDWGDGSRISRNESIARHRYQPGEYTLRALAITPGAVQLRSCVVRARTGGRSSLLIDLVDYPPLSVANQNLTFVDSFTLLCAPDFNHDDFLDFFDYADFVACFEGAGCESGDPLAADFNADGFVDFFDYSDFVAAFEAGC